MRVTRRILLCSLGGAWAEAAQETRSEKVVYLGESRIRIVVRNVDGNGRKTLVYFHPHENEHGSAVVTRHTINSSGGRLVEIRSQGDRLITFKLRGASYSFDPNHMFTDAGLQRSLRHFGPFAGAALESARNLRNAVLTQLGRGRTPIVAVHNNAEEGLNALAYKKGGAFEAAAAKVAINPNEKPHNFFLVLNEALFSELHHAGFNTVLQSPNAPDDGSLSVFCQRQNWPYIKVEASESDINQQKRMLEALPPLLFADNAGKAG